MSGKTQSTSFTEKLMQYCSVFGLVPWYSAQQTRLVYKKAFKCFSAVSATAILCLSLILFYVRYHFVYIDQTVFVLLAALMELASLSKFLVTVSSAGFWNMCAWEEFLKQIITLKKVTENTPKNFVTKNERIIFFLGNVFVIALFLSEIVAYKDTMISLYFASDYILIYTGFLTVYLTMNITGIVSCGYRHIKDSMESLSNKGRLNSSCVKILRKIRSSFSMLTEVTDNFNILLGWGLLFTIFEEVLNVLGCLIYMTQKNFHYLDEKFMVEDQQKAVNFFYIVASTVSISFEVFL